MFVTTLASAEDLDYSREEVRPKSSLSTVDDHILAQVSLTFYVFPPR